MSVSESEPVSVIVGCLDLGAHSRGMFLCAHACEYQCYMYIYTRAHTHKAAGCKRACIRAQHTLLDVRINALWHYTLDLLLHLELCQALILKTPIV
jgi:hypothetical protein